ncbi:unnamed protein product [Schistosoma margrebowiei]|uniref:Uncharacterized protein n=1 Tax=Schistosoma margrebowiei TaxID=48269 RepID=A0A183LFM0_9TREM|nr:unnamed protein product [Schistosoma margrebowiei]
MYTETVCKKYFLCYGPGLFISLYFPPQCRAENEIRPRELVRCLECGHRVLYKKRSKRSNVYSFRLSTIEP